MKKFFAAVFLCLLLSACWKKNVIEKLGWKKWGESIHHVDDITIHMLWNQNNDTLTMSQQDDTMSVLSDKNGDEMLKFVILPMSEAWQQSEKIVETTINGRQNFHDVMGKYDVYWSAINENYALLVIELGSTVDLLLPEFEDGTVCNGKMTFASTEKTDENDAQETTVSFVVKNGVSNTATFTNGYSFYLEGNTINVQEINDGTVKGLYSNKNEQSVNVTLSDYQDGSNALEKFEGMLNEGFVQRSAENSWWGFGTVDGLPAAWLLVNDPNNHLQSIYVTAN